MKKIFPVAIIVVVIAVIAVLSSCKKSYSCTCVYYVNGVSYPAGNFTFSDMRDDAQLLCNNKQQAFPAITNPVTCDLK